MLVCWTVPPTVVLIRHLHRHAWLYITRLKLLKYHVCESFPSANVGWEEGFHRSHILLVYLLRRRASAGRLPMVPRTYQLFFIFIVDKCFGGVVIFFVIIIVQWRLGTNR